MVQQAVSPAVDQLVEDIYAKTITCRRGDCDQPAARWYVRVDVEDDRLTIIPVCLEHFAAAAEVACGPNCSAPESDHYLTIHEQLVPQLTGALGHGMGIGFPVRSDWQRVDVIRPRIH